MPLDHDNGETIPELGPGFHVAKGKQKDYWKHTSLWDEACKDAARVFHIEGALLPVVFDDRQILVQEYPRDRKLVFIFCRPVAQRELFHIFTFDLPPEMIAELKVTGKWQHSH